MTALDKIKQWLATYPGWEELNLSVDWTSKVPGNSGLFPDGLVEQKRTSDILGNVTVWNQYNFGLFYVFTKAPGDPEGAEVNAEWVMDFQNWVQAQSARHLAPTFGDEPNTERITAQNGTLYNADAEGTAVYMVQLSASFIKHFKEV